MDPKRAVRVLVMAFLSIIIFYSFGLVAWERGAEKIAFRYGYSESVKIQNPSDIRWQNHQEFIKKQVTELVRVSRELGIFDENVLPIRIGISKNYMRGGVAYSHYSRFVSKIYIDSYYLDLKIINYSDLRVSIAHEFSHFLQWQDKHGLAWKKTCQAIFSRMLRGWKKEIGSDSIIWPDPCIK